MTLHEAIKKVLYEADNSRTSTEIAASIYELSLYERRDGKAITASQVSARVRKYPSLFVREGRMISLAEPETEKTETFDEILAKKQRKQNIKGISLKNFKGFGDKEQYIPIKPITLLFGANSSGKSSIIHSLLYARESARTGKFDFTHTEISGDSVDFGGFKNLIHGHRWEDEDLSVTIEADVQHKSAKILREIGPENSLEKFDIYEDKNSIDLRYSFDIRLSEQFGVEPVVSNALMELNGNWFVKLSPLSDYDKVRQEGHRLKHVIQQINTSHKIMDRFLDGVINLSLDTESEDTYKKKKDLIKMLDERKTDYPLFLEGIFPELASSKSGPFHSLKERLDSESIMLNNFVTIIGEYVLHPLLQLKTILNNMVYLGPLRKYPIRHFAFSSFQQDSNWLAGGGQAWDMLLRDDTLRKKVNEWLNDESLLDIPYRWEIKNLYWSENFERILESFFHEDSDFVTTNYGEGGGPDEWKPGLIVDFDQLSEIPDDVLNELRESGTSELKELILIDTSNRNLRLNHRDVGVGISQIMPVIINSLAHTNKFICIEEPEIHVHPDLQANLGDVFIESAVKNGNTLILETHSEHLILRLLRRIREGGIVVGGEKRSFSKEDLSVIHVGKIRGKSVVSEIEISKDGKFLDPWPDDFFEQDIKELKV